MYYVRRQRGLLCKRIWPACEVSGHLFRHDRYGCLSFWPLKKERGAFDGSHQLIWGMLYIYIQVRPPLNPFSASWRLDLELYKFPFEAVVYNEGAELQVGVTDIGWLDWKSSINQNLMNKLPCVRLLSGFGTRSKTVGWRGTDKLLTSSWNILSE